MSHEIALKIILENPPAGIVFGIQKGSGNNYETIQKQISGAAILHFNFTITVKWNKDGSPNFLGAFVQGPPTERFIYIDIGTAAGDINSVWSRRLKIPLKGITIEMINKLLTGSAIILETKVPGTGKDGGPNCATVKPFSGWYLSQINNDEK